MKRTDLAAAVRRIGWGYLLIFLHFNLSMSGFTLDLLPDWLGYFLMARALGTLVAVRPSLGLIVNFSWALGFWQLTDLVSGLSEVPLFGFFSLLFSLMSLYFDFQLFTDLAALALEHLPRAEGKDRNRTLLHLRTAAVLVGTLMHLPDLLLALPEWSLVVLLLASLIMAFWSAHELFGLSKALEAQA